MKRRDLFAVPLVALPEGSTRVPGYSRHQFKEGEGVVSMIIHHGRLLIATNCAIYEFKDDVLQPILIVR